MKANCELPRTNANILPNKVKDRFKKMNKTKAYFSQSSIELHLQFFMIKNSAECVLKMAPMRLSQQI